ncbi:MAG: chemotaxis response regulator protein-glutamate methylesterase [Phycisphaerales bacterium]|nr:chemotaxis response regulator protein-glutamate methylesterase [Phycisphaerales bacterium]
MRKMISQMITSDPGLRVVDTARNGADGVEKAKLLRPDVVTLDIEMPVMDGLTALRKIRAECPAPPPAVLMCSSLTSQGSHEALTAMRLGAADVIAKEPDAIGGSAGMRNELVGKIRAIAGTARRRPAAKATPAGKAPPPLPPGTRLIAVGSSTGGPPVLEHILTRLPADLPAPVVVAQHMPPLFTRSLAQRLDSLCAMTVVHGEDRQPLHPGTVYILPGGQHGRVVRAGAALRLEVNGEPAAALYKPSVNELFRSAGESLGNRAAGVMLTGMGDDGAAGAETLHAAGGLIVAQSAETCVVYGMPRAVVERGVAAASCAPEAITLWICSLAPDRGAAPGAESGTGRKVA